MLKKNQLALILLTLVLMLTVYYITSPFDKEKDKDDDDKNPIVETGRLQELTAKRTTIREERALAVLGLDSIIADSSKSIAEKTAAIEEKRYLNSLTEKELMLELEVIAMGYRDSFVHVTDTGIEIVVVGKEENHSLSKANEIVIKTVMRFNENYDNVVVKFYTTEQVMGEVN